MAATSEDEPQRVRPRFPVLDGLRGIAIILLIIWHYFCCGIDPASPIQAAIFAVFSISWSGVDLFFVLSGFLIGGILLDERESKSLFKVFYTRRALRILPLYAVLLVAYFSILALGDSPQNILKQPWLFDGKIPQWSYLVFLQNIFMAGASSFGPLWLGVTWSLCLEEQFYLLLPWLVILCPHRFLPRVLTLMIAFVPVVRVLVAVLFHSTFPCYVLLFTRADGLLLGVLIAYLMRQPAWSELGAKRRTLWLTLILLGAGLVAITWYQGNIISLAMVCVGYYLIAFFYSCLVVLALVSNGTRLERVLNNKFLTYSGRISYCLYLVHQPVSGLCHGILLHSPPGVASPSSAAVTLLALAITYGIAHFSWIYFEAPLQRLGHRMKY